MAAGNPSVSEAAGQMPQELSLEELLDNFELLEDWDSRYAYLVELGEALPPLPESLRTEENLVKGCMSQVWVCAQSLDSHSQRIFYQGDCDTAIIKGVLAVLVGLYSGRTQAEIEELDVDGLFDRLGLKENLSPNRHVGVYAIIDLMQEQARQVA